MPTPSPRALFVGDEASAALLDALVPLVYGERLAALQACAGRPSADVREVLDEIGAAAGPLPVAPQPLDPRCFDLVVAISEVDGDAHATPPALAGASIRRWQLPAAPGADAPPEERRLLHRARRDHLHALLLALARELGLTDPAPAAPPRGPRPPVVAIVGWKNSGKTTLVERLVRALSARGLRVATVKATHHDVDPDPPGKDSWVHRQAGAVETVLVGPRRFVLTHEGAVPWWAAAQRLEGADLVLLEGFRTAPVPKVEVVAPGTGRPVLAREDRAVFVVAADAPIDGLAVPVLRRDDVAGLAEAILARAAGSRD